MIGMARRVREVLPQVPMAAIRKDLGEEREAAGRPRCGAVPFSQEGSWVLRGREGLHLGNLGRVGSLLQHGGGPWADFLALCQALSRAS